MNSNDEDNTDEEQLNQLEEQYSTESNVDQIDRQITDEGKLLEGMDTSGDVYIHLKTREVYELLGKMLAADENGSLDAYIESIKKKLNNTENNSVFKTDVYNTFIELYEEIQAYETK